MIEYPHAPTPWVTCSCCGEYVHNSREANAALHLADDQAYPCDDGYGQCFECFGDPFIDAERTDDDAVKARLGFAGRTFYDARIKLIRKSLTGDRALKFEAMDYALQVAMVNRALEEGIIKW